MNDLPDITDKEYDPEKTLYELFSKYPDSSHLWTQSMNHTRMAMSISDPRQNDNPLVYVNRAFCDLTGYEPHEVLGKNCRFLQGEETSAVKTSAIRSLLKTQGSGVVELVNYRKDGTKFWNALHLSPLKDKDGEVCFFFGSQWNVTDEIAAKAADDQFKTINRELNHHVMNILAVVSSLVTMSAAGAPSAHTAASRTRERISALATAHRATMNWSTKNEMISVEELIRVLLKPYLERSNREFRLEGRDVHLNPDLITPLGLVIHELATNSISHGYLAQKAESAKVSWNCEQDPDSDDTILKIGWVERFADEKTNAASHTGSGSKIMNAMLIQAGGVMTRAMTGRDYTVNIALPIGHDGA